MKRLVVATLTLLVTVLFSSPIVLVHAQDSEPVVHAILFYSPSCPHCSKVISEDLPPLFAKYGEQLQIIGIDVSQQGGQILYSAAIQHYAIPPERMGVPTLIIDTIVLVGSLEIPEQLPILIESYLSQGGVDWPDIPGLKEALPPASPTTSATASFTVTPTNVPPSATNVVQPTAIQSTSVPATATQSPVPSPVPPTSTPGLIMTGEQNRNPDWRNNFVRDWVGNTLAVVVLVGMAVTVIWSTITFIRSRAAATLKDSWSLIIPALCMVGLGIAGYLAYVETTQIDAVCGPVGDCNTVQQSEYARLFGILPIGVLGLIGYLVIGFTWTVARFVDGWLAELATISLFAIAFFGTLFSVYLTFLEPFVIGATCAWCLTSAVLMMVLLALSSKPAKYAFLKIY